MTSYRDLLTNHLVQVTTAPKLMAKRKSSGCLGCPLDGKKGTNRSIGIQTEDAKVAVWGMTQEFPFNWVVAKLRKLSGLRTRDITCQTVVRCNDPKHSYEPRPEAVRSCQFHTSNERQQLTAKVWLVFGEETLKQLFPKQGVSKTVFWSERDRVRVFYFSDKFVQADGWRGEEFDKKLEELVPKFLIHHQSRWALLESMDFRGVYRASSVRKLLAEYKARGRRVSMDIETGIVNGKPVLLCVGFSNSRDKARCVVLDHPQNPTPKAERREIFGLLREFLEDPTIKKTMHYGCSDAEGFEKLAGICIDGYEYDTFYSSFLKSSFRRAHGLEAVGDDFFWEYSGHKDLVHESLEGASIDGTYNYADIPLDRLILYNCADAALTHRAEIRTKSVRPALVRSYVWAGNVLYKMQSRGPKLDYNLLKIVSDFIPPVVQRSLTLLRKITGNPNFNPNTPAEVADYIYRKAKLAEPVEEYDRDRDETVIKYPTDDNALKLMIAGGCTSPFPKALQTFRKYSKLMSTYVEGYRESADMHGGELRTFWHLTGAVTGRLRSGDKGKRGIVNLQNIAGDPLISNLLISDVDWGRYLTRDWDSLKNLYCFLALDYSQIEIRMLAEVTQDPGLIAIFKRGGDSHCQVGARLTGWKEEAIANDKVVRRFIKALHFGIVYGLSPAGLHRNLVAEGLKFKRSYVDKMYRRYFEEFGKVKTFMENQWAFASQHGYVETMFGFTRYVGNEYEEDRQTSARNQSINAPIQGAAHQLLLNALASLDRKPQRYNLLQEPVMEVHDALVFRVRVGDLHTAFKQAKRLLEREVPVFCEREFNRPLSVPLVAEASVGFRYGELVEYDSAAIDKNNGSLPGGDTILKDLRAMNAVIRQKIEEKHGLSLAW